MVLGVIDGIGAGVGVEVWLRVCGGERGMTVSGEDKGPRKRKTVSFHVL